jgi:hypothetical protein
VLLHGDGLIGKDKRRGDFIYAWRLSVCAVHSKSSENSSCVSVVTAA